MPVPSNSCTTSPLAAQERRPLTATSGDWPFVCSRSAVKEVPPIAPVFSGTSTPSETPTPAPTHQVDWRQVRSPPALSVGTGGTWHVARSMECSAHERTYLDDRRVNSQPRRHGGVGAGHLDRHGDGGNSGDRRNGHLHSNLRGPASQRSRVEAAACGNQSVSLQSVCLSVSSQRAVSILAPPILQSGAGQTDAGGNCPPSQRLGGVKQRVPSGQLRCETPSPTGRRRCSSGRPSPGTPRPAGMPAW
eukprot:COSAG01_NODE_6635_length_3568_cov_8.046411_4_plen_247_part_00